MSFAAAVLLGGALLLAPPLYLLGPFALLTLFARPRTPRELLWLVVSGSAVAVALSAGRDLGAQVLQASGLVLTGFFVLLYARSRSAVFPRALAAVALTALALVLWAGRLGIGWGEVERAFTDMLQASCRSLAELAGRSATSGPAPESFARSCEEAAPGVARLMPALLTLQGLAGTLLAAWWHHRIAAVPLGAAPSPFRDFRFNDHLIWGAIFSLGFLLAPLPPDGRTAALNLLAVWAGLYAARGLAIVATVLAAAPAALKLFSASLALLLAPVALGACVTLGLADTWLDIRGRLRPPVPGGA
ncbi:MAG TPA: DUF2232 domain-containing protein [Gemmatimonadales bacterium]|nr:DUF2232 domain-containing protein [Gemmatimonadales bacterium]